MKKTTIIMIVLAALMVIASFAGPLIIFKRSDRPVSPEKEIKLTGRTDTLTTRPFSRLEVSNAYITQPLNKPGEDEKNITLRILLRESTKVSIPVIALDQGWAENIRVEVKDSVCNLVFDGNASNPAAAGKQSHTGNVILSYTEKESLVAEMTLPVGMLKDIKSFPVEVDLEDFRDAALNLWYSTLFNITNSSFRELTLK